MLTQPQPNPRPTIIISEPRDVDRALFEIDGLTRNVLIDAVEEGERGRQNCTEHHPVTAPGTMFYFDTVRALRDFLVPEWRPKCDGGSELTISPTGKHAIVVACGDANVGSLTSAPRTKRKKGRLTRKAARANLMALYQGDLFGEFSRADYLALVEERERNPTMLTHMLLAHREGERLVIELSLVSGFDVDGHAAEWAQRIIVGTLPLDGSTRLFDTPVADAPAPEFDVAVSRRSA
jgi:hypothetical protein